MGTECRLVYIHTVTLEVIISNMVLALPRSIVSIKGAQFQAAWYHKQSKWSWDDEQVKSMNRFRGRVLNGHPFHQWANLFLTAGCKFQYVYISFKKTALKADVQHEFGWTSRITSQ